MRDLIDKLTLLQEATGLANRKPGTIFKNSSGEEIQFKELMFFPEGGGRFTSEQLANAVDQISATLDSKINWENARSSRSGGFALATFDSPTGDLYFGRYLEAIKPSFTDNYIPNQVGDYRFTGKAAEKIQAGLSPQDLLREKTEDLSIADIMNQLATSLGTDHPLYAVAHRVAMKEEFPIEFPIPEGISFSAFRDYFSEILQPIAFQNRMYTGNADEAIDIFLGGTVEGTKINFSTSKNEGLSDSIITNSQGKLVKISSKGNKGATASTKNLLDSVKETEENPSTVKLVKKYAFEINLIKSIVEKGQNMAPLYLAQMYDVINSSEAETIKSLRTNAPVNLKSVENSGMSDRLKELAKERVTKNPESVNLYYHLLAAVAHKVAEVVNKKSNFSKAAAEILNNGALVQMYTKAREGKESCVLQGFNTVYPGDSIKGVYLSASKNYSSTGIKGNFTFKIDSGSGVADEGNTDTSVAEPMGDEEFAAVAQDITQPKRAKPEKEVGVGRQKRK